MTAQVHRGTPVTAQVHRGTLVTAQVPYLLLYFTSVFQALFDMVLHAGDGSGYEYEGKNGLDPQVSSSSCKPPLFVSFYFPLSSFFSCLSSLV